MQSLFLKEDVPTVKTLIEEQRRYTKLADIEISKGKFEQAKTFSKHALAMLERVAILQFNKEKRGERTEQNRQKHYEGMINHMLEQRRLWF